MIPIVGFFITYSVLRRILSFLMIYLFSNPQHFYSKSVYTTSKVDQIKVRQHEREVNAWEDYSGNPLKSA